MLLTLGPTRADVDPSIEKLEVSSGPVLLQVARELAWVEFILARLNGTDRRHRSSQLAVDPALRQVLESGVITSVEDV